MKLKYLRTGEFRLWVLINVVILVFAACTTMGPDQPVVVGSGGLFSGDFTEQDITVLDGRTVHCLFWVVGSGQNQHGGMSCDWENAK